MIATAYPANPAARTRWILQQRPPPNRLDTDVPHAFFNEQERMENGEIARVSTLLLTNRECPWKCLMCDLWRNTAPAPPGSVPRQIEHALAKLPPASVLKLYNSGSFFDPAAIPPGDWREIVALCLPFEHLVLECHPKLIGPRVLDFAGTFEGQIEIAMGLETVHPVALDRLNKQITVDDFTRAAAFLRNNDIAVRTFLLVNPPFIPPDQQQVWIEKSIRRAIDCGTNVVSLIPTRARNGALEALQDTGDFREPSLFDLEAAHDFGVRLGRIRVFADTWDLERFASCRVCAQRRRERMERMNRSQRIEPRIHCSCET